MRTPARFTLSLAALLLMAFLIAPTSLAAEPAPTETEASTATSTPAASHDGEPGVGGDEELQPAFGELEPQRKIPHPTCDPQNETVVTTYLALSPVADCQSSCTDWCQNQYGTYEWSQANYQRGTCYCRCCVPN